LRRSGKGLWRAFDSGVHRLLAIFFLSQIVHAQPLSFGIVAGGSVTNDFNIAAGYPLAEYSTPRRYVVGAMLELALKAGWSLDLDGLFHPLGFSSAVSPATVATWELPVMAKYWFSGRRFTPFLEGGAAFRTAGNLNATNPSHTGVIAGAGGGALRAIPHFTGSALHTLGRGSVLRRDDRFQLGGAAGGVQHRAVWPPPLLRTARFVRSGCRSDAHAGLRKVSVQRNHNLGNR
jgi:hypothetical protein